MVRAITDIAAFRTGRPWGARDRADVDGATFRLQWTDQPYKWRVNDGAEVSVGLGGEVDGPIRQNGRDDFIRLRPSDIFVADVGDEPVAHPVGEARIRVIGRKGSV